jgi:magnesium-transporting ATPase (P-type)
LNGLTRKQAQDLLRQHEPNRLQKATQQALVLQFPGHFRNPLVIVLLCASALSALTGDRSGALIIALIVVMSVTLDFVQATATAAEAPAPNTHPDWPPGPPKRPARPQKLRDRHFSGKTG